MTTVADFRARYPEFDAVAYPSARVQMALDDAGAEISATVWGGFYERGIYALAAHGLQCLIGGAAVGSVGSGAVVSHSVGDVSETFAGPARYDALYSTAYGSEYLRLRGLLGCGPQVV